MSEQVPAACLWNLTLGLADLLLVLFRSYIKPPCVAEGAFPRGKAFNKKVQLHSTQQGLSDLSAPHLNDCACGKSTQRRPPASGQGTQEQDPNPLLKALVSGGRIHCRLSQQDPCIQAELESQYSYPPLRHSLT